MSEVGTGADALQFYHSGAASIGVGQRDDLACLGGNRSSTRFDPFTVLRPTPMRGIRVDYVSPENVLSHSGDRLGTIAAVTADSLSWTQPGTLNAGDAVTIANGETKLIEGTNPSDYIIVTRTSADDLVGREVIQLRWNFNNAISGQNWTEEEITATPSLARYSCIFVKNAGSSTITGIDITASGVVTVGPGPGTGTDTEQTIADNETAPGGITFYTTSPTLTLNAGATSVLWVKISGVSTTASPRETASFRIEYTYDGTDYEQTLAGYYRISDDDLARWEVYATKGADPDPINDSPVTTTQTTSYTYAQDLTEGEWRIGVCKRNKYNVLGPMSDLRSVYIDSSGDEETQPPNPPDLVEMQPSTDGAFEVVAEYTPALAGSTEAEALTNRADTWLIYLTTDGTNPDPDSDTPIEVEMALPDLTELTPETLTYTTTATTLDNTPGKVIVRTCRSGTESKNSDIVTANSFKFGPGRPLVKALVGLHGVPSGFTTPPDGTPVYTDQPNNIYWKPEEGSVSLYADTTLVWRAVYAETPMLYIPDGWDITQGTVSGAGSSDAIETVSWTGGDKRLTVNVNSVRRLEIDVTNMTITVDDLQGATMPAVAAESSAWQRYTDTVFQVFNPATENYAPYCLVDSDSAWQIGSDFTLNGGLTQAQVEAL